ncbi:MAG TPA: MBOAT family protein, partial [Chthoniobacteraceae bacterium]|nr:MBOAT family protein [Chthoniobacteraceae bacterium]
PGPLSAGWIGMIGMIFLFHFGFVKGLALYWQWNGICAGPLMRMPVAANSVGDFWGKRWNSAFRDLSFGLMFNSFRKWCGTRGATLLTFFISGLIHELVITLPAGGGYGLPTAYFTLQGAGLLCEHSHPARGWLRSALHGRLFAWLIVAGPAFALFPPPFVQRVIVPFMQAIGALPGGHL